MERRRLGLEHREGARRRPAARGVPRLGLGEELLGQADRGLDEDLLAFGRDVRREADATVAVVGLVAAELVLGRRREVGREAVRVAAGQRRAAGARSFTAMPISLKISPEAVVITPSPIRTAWIHPGVDVGAVPSRSAASVFRAQFAW